jgi:hypothetical protein
LRYIKNHLYVTAQNNHQLCSLQILTLTGGHTMKILIDLFSTDYGLMSLIVIAVITIVMTWAGIYVYLKARK